MASLPYFLDPAPGYGTLPGRAALASDRPELCLDGRWGFRYSPTTAAAAADPCTADFPETVAVPGHWMLDEANGPLITGTVNRFGSPWYTNVQYPFPIDPPFVPDANGTGDYLREFDLETGVLADWKELETVLLRFEGVESTYKVWLNGMELGHASGSRLTHEFDVSKHLRARGNRLVVRVHQFSAASYLEDQDQWWLPGIFRSVTLIGQPRAGIRDLRAEALFDGGTGTITLTAAAGPEAFPLAFNVPELGFSAQLASDGPVTFTLGSVLPWTAETPRLYEGVLSSATENIRLKLGFRTVRIEQGVLLINGSPVRLKGVNRHEFDPAAGRAVTAAFSRAELLSMKQHNINAIRTSHYPPNHHLLELADELGFWVIDECDLETHGFVLSGWKDNPADSPEWADACLDRMERTWRRDANHASVIMFSLGNESDTGRNLAAMAGWLHEIDPRRPVHYEGDRTCAYTDVYSRMYATPEECRSISAGRPVPGLTTEAAARVASKPFVLCEYAHAMGNGPGALEVYEELMDANPHFIGGFVWEWKDHGLSALTPDGHAVTAYGGDFREPVHDGNFVLDGLAFADGTPSPGLKEFAKVIEPLRLEVGTGSVTVRNRQDFADTQEFRFHWQIQDSEGKRLATGTLAIPPVPARSSATEVLPREAAEIMNFPPAGGAALTVSALLAEPAPWADAGHEVAWGQLVAQPELSGADHSAGTAAHSVGTAAPAAAGTAAGPAAGAAPEPKITAGAASDFVLAPDGMLQQLGGTALSGALLSVWRAPTDNDRGSIEPNRELRMAEPVGFDWDAYAGTSKGPVIALADKWAQARLDRLSRRTVSVLPLGNGGIAAEHRYGPPSGTAAMTTKLCWTPVPNGVQLDASISSDKAWGFPLARLGFAFQLPAEALSGASSVRWLGQGPGESYPDAASAQRWGAHELPAELMGTRYPRPQENGRRSGLRWLEADLEDGLILRVEVVGRPSAGAGFSLLPWSAAELAAAQHDGELPAPQAWHLVLDAGVHGLGSRSCGVDVLPGHTLIADSARLRLQFTVRGRETAQTEQMMMELQQRAEVRQRPWSGWSGISC